jgi:colanic acid/amylovoran biosynthesis glycosyltransferase
VVSDQLGRNVRAPGKNDSQLRNLRVVHVIPYYLRPSETFIYTQLQSQATPDQVVVTRRAANRAWFPFDRIYESAPMEGSERGERVARAARRLTGRPNNYQRRIIGVVGEFEGEVLHAHFGWSGVEAIPPAQHLNVPLVTAFHGSDVYVKRPGDRLSDSYHKLFRVGTIFTCVGPNAGDALIRRGCPRDRLRIVPVGIDLGAFPFRKTQPEGPFTILQVSRLAPKKGVDLSLRAFAKVRESIGDARLWIVGDGPEQRSLVELAKRLGIDHSVKFYGAMASIRTQELMRKAHLGIQPSRIAPNGDREGTPTVLLEFQAIGVEVVASRHADIPSIVAHPDELVEENNVEQLAVAMTLSATRSTTARRERANAGRAVIERRHDAKQIAVQLAEVYRDAVAWSRHA